MAYIFQSERLGFRKWQDRDIKPLAELCADPEVMRFFLDPLSYDQSEKLLKKINELFEHHRYGAYAVELLESGAFIGFIGFAYCDIEVTFTPCVEILWRLAKQYWGHGYGLWEIRIGHR